MTFPPRALATRVAGTAARILVKKPCRSRVAMEIMRHSDMRLTSKTYTDAKKRETGRGDRIRTRRRAMITRNLQRETHKETHKARARRLILN